MAALGRFGADLARRAPRRLRVRGLADARRSRPRRGRRRARSRGPSPSPVRRTRWRNVQPLRRARRPGRRARRTARPTAWRRRGARSRRASTTGRVGHDRRAHDAAEVELAARSRSNVSSTAPPSRDEVAQRAFRESRRVVAEQVGVTPGCTPRRRVMSRLDDRDRVRRRRPRRSATRRARVEVTVLDPLGAARSASRARSAHAA